jgi:hypothetical protein
MADKQPQNYEAINAIVEQLTLFDDTLMSKVFDKNIPATELLLRIILEQEDIQVKEVTSQEALMNPHTDGRNLKLDIVATDSTGRYFNVEVQRSNDGAHFRRARFHSSMLDARMLKEKQKFKELMDSYVIFITEKDIVGEGLATYHVDRIIRETQKPFEDGAHIIYVNGAYQGEDAIGRLMKDMQCTNGEEMYYEELAKGINHFKKRGGRAEMCEIIEAYARGEVEKEKKKAEEEKAEMIKGLMKNTGLTPEKAMDMLDIPQDHREKLMAHFNASK